MTDQEMHTEISSLRDQLEACRERELGDLRTQLADAKTLAEHYRQEAERNASLGHQIARESEAERGKLMERVHALERTSAVVRPERRTS